LADAPLPITQTNPFLAWGALVASVLVPCLPIVAGKMRDRSKDPSRPAPATTSSGAANTTIAAVDAQGMLLSALVADVQRRAERAEEKLEDARHEITQLRVRVATLTDEVKQLQDRLINRSWGGP
jgi:septal ring factor EnvC (AmiA/AmiB activator)